MYFIVYQTTNIINGHIYIGVHKTSNINDGYIGSGLIFRKAVKQYGRENFKRQILHLCSSIEEMYDLESKLVDREFVNRRDTYNVKLGGRSGSINPRETEYYGSGWHIKNALRSIRKAVESNAMRLQDRISQYDVNPNKCSCCNSALDYNKRNNKFCSRSCSATYHNLRRVVSEDSKMKCSATWKTKTGNLAAQRKAERKERTAINRELKRNVRLNELAKLEELLVSQPRGWVSIVADKLKMHPKDVKKWIIQNIEHILDYGIRINPV